MRTKNLTFIVLAALLLLVLACKREHEETIHALPPLGHVYRVGDDVKAPMAVWRNQADVARCSSSYSGLVIAQATIDSTGLVRDAHILRSSNDPCIDEAALAAFKEWRFKPATHDHEPVAVDFSLTMMIQRR